VTLSSPPLASSLSRARWATAIGALAALVGVAGVALWLSPTASRAQTSCPQDASASAPIDRVAGAERYATAACAAAASYPDGADHVILARGDSAGGLADALAGAVLADDVAGPVLLTAPDTLPSATAAEISRLDAERVTVLGGSGAVSGAVVAQLEDQGVEVDRLAGRNRFDTAARAANEAGAGSTAFVVNGFSPPDSLVAAAPAARTGSKLLLVTRGEVPAATAAALGGVDEVVIVGGHGVVGRDVAARVGELADAPVRRVAGGTRAATAASVARAFPGDGRIRLAAQSDEHLVDAVTAGWAAARPGGGPVLYTGTDAPGHAADRWLRLGGLGSAEDPVATRLVGGSAVLSDSLVDALESRYEEAAAGGRPAELRATWVHLFDDALKSRAGIHRVLNEAAAANANTVIVQVARRQDAYYDSDVLPRTPDPAMPGDLDLLGELVSAAHDRGLRVHAWVPVLQAYHETYDELSLPPDHVWRQHGPGSDDHWLQVSDTGATKTFLDPGVPGVQNHVAALMRELAADYDVDAVHTDYLRYTGAGEWGYHPASLARFREQTGYDGTPPPTSPSWSSWRRRQTADLARRVFLETLAVDPTTAVSMAGSTMGPGPAHAGGYRKTRTYSWVYQNWPSWLAEGTVDAVMAMNYFREGKPEHRAWFDDWVAFEQDLPRNGGLLALGQGAYLNSADQSLAQMGRASSRLDGVALYSHQLNAATGTPQGLLARLSSTAWAEPAPAPQLSDRRAGGHLLVEAADGVEVSAEPAAGGGDAASQAADATGHAGLLWLTPGSWTVDAPGHDPATVTVRPGEVTRVSLSAAP